MTDTSPRYKRNPAGSEDQVRMREHGLSLPLSDQEVEELFDRHAIPPTGRAIIQRIRKSQPGRAVDSTTYSGDGRYISLKMGCTLDAEAHSTEWLRIEELDNDTDTLEIYSQPDHRLKVPYVSSASGRNQTILTRPDIFTIGADGFTFEECKSEEELLTLSAKYPDRFVRDEDGRWSSPPAQAAARAIGCRFVIRSAAQNNWALHENLELLRDFREAHLQGRLELDQRAKHAIKKILKDRAFISAIDLMDDGNGVQGDDAYTAIVLGQLFFPLQKKRLTDFTSAIYFRSEKDWEAYKLLLQSEQPALRPVPRSIPNPGDPFKWSGVQFKTLNVGTKISALRLDGSEGLIEMTQAQWLERLGKDIEWTPSESGAGTEAEERMKLASAKDVQKATWKHQVLTGQISKDNPYRDRCARSKAYWARDFTEAEDRYGNGFIGLLPKTHAPRALRLTHTSHETAKRIIKENYGDPRCLSIMHCWGLYKEALADGDCAGTYQWFWDLVKKQGGYEQLASRVGEKAAHDDEPAYLNLERTTPVHGTHSWHIAHIDHTPLPLKFITEETSETTETVWLTLLIGTYDRCVHAWYISFRRPSALSNMMVIRECVRKHGRLPQIIVSDNGSDFQSVHYETLIAYLGLHKRNRPKGQPRFGSVLERFFGVSQQQFIKRLFGSTELQEKNFRRVPKQLNPKERAVWYLTAFDAALEEYIEQHYHVVAHSALDMSPMAMQQLSMKRHGSRPFKRVAYDDQFIAVTCPAAHRGGRAKVQPQGVLINYVYYGGDVLNRPGIQGTRVPARYDPWDAGTAYVFIDGRWHTVHSRYHAVFKELAIADIRYATEAIRASSKDGKAHALVNTQELVKFFARVENTEERLKRRRQKAEEDALRAKRAPPPPAPPRRTPKALPQPAQAQLPVTQPAVQAPKEVVELIDGEL